VPQLIALASGDGSVVTSFVVSHKREQKSQRSIFFLAIKSELVDFSRGNTLEIGTKTALPSIEPTAHTHTYTLGAEEAPFVVSLFYGQATLEENSSAATLRDRT